MNGNKPAAQPLVSVIIPLFNREDIVIETIQSVASQSYDVLEIIVVDDCSDDRGPERVREFADKDDRVSLLAGGAGHCGAPVCRNTGYEQSTGEFVIFLDSDDLLGTSKPREHYILPPVYRIDTEDAQNAILGV